MLISQSAAAEPVNKTIHNGLSSVPAEPNNRQKGNNVELSAANPHYITPTELADASRRTLGEIDLDPASSDHANNIIKAAQYFTPVSDGLAKSWGKKSNPNRVYNNPPGGVLKLNKAGDRWIPVRRGPGESSQFVWMQKFRTENKARKCYGVYLSFNPEPIVRKHGDILKKNPHVWLYKRPCFQNWNDEQQAFITDKSPRKHCLIVLILPFWDTESSAKLTERFTENFSPYGEVIDPTPKPITTEAVIDTADNMSTDELAQLIAALQGINEFKENVASNGGEYAPNAAAPSSNKKKSGGYIEMKKIGSCGPYPYLRWRDKNGRLRSRYLKSKSRAQAGERRRQRRIAKQESV